MTKTYSPKLITQHIHADDPEETEFAGTALDAVAVRPFAVITIRGDIDMFLSLETITKLRAAIDAAERALIEITARRKVEAEKAAHIAGDPDVEVAVHPPSDQK